MLRKISQISNVSQLQKFQLSGEQAKMGTSRLFKETYDKQILKKDRPPVTYVNHVDDQIGNMPSTDTFQDEEQYQSDITQGSFNQSAQVSASPNLFDDNMIQIDFIEFQVHYCVKFGQSVVMVGSVPELGSWDALGNA